MGGLFSRKQKKNTSVMKSKAQEQVYEVDIIKSKIKISRDRVNNMIKLKNNDIAQINKKIKQQLPNYQQTGNKRNLVPLLQAKKNLQKFTDNAEVRVKLLNQKLSEVEMQQVNADTINALDDSNKYIKEMQELMEKKDWQGVIQDAKEKYQLDWGQDQEEIQEDPAFQALWDELGGNKLPAKNNKQKQIEKKKVAVEIPANKEINENKYQQKQKVLA